MDSSSTLDVGLGPLDPGQSAAHLPPRQRPSSSSADERKKNSEISGRTRDFDGEETDDSDQNPTSSRNACRVSEFLDFNSVAHIIEQQQEYNDRKERIYQLLKQRWIAAYLNEEEVINVDALNQEFLSEKLLQQYGEIDSTTGKYDLMLEEFGASLREAVQEWTEEAEAIKSGEKEPAGEITISEGEAQKLFRHINSWADSGEPYAQFVISRRVVPHEEMFREVEELYRAKAEEERPQPGTSTQPPPSNLFPFHQSQFVINPATNEVRLKSFLRRDPKVCLRPKGAYSTVHPRGDAMLKGLDDTIRLFKFGICPDHFMRELKSIHRLMVLPDFYMKYSDLFFVKRIKVDLWFGNSPISSSEDRYVDPAADSVNELGQIILFPKFLKTTNFDINKFYFSIWHSYEILLSRISKPILCEAAQKLLEDKFGIQFNPLHWGFIHMVDFFSDCIQKYSNGSHFVTQSAPFFLVHSGFAPGLLERSIVLEVEKLQRVDDDAFPKIPREFVPRHANILDGTNVADFIKPGAYIRCLPEYLYEPHFFFVRTASSRFLLDQLTKNMAAAYDDDKILEVDPAYLDCSGMFFAVRCKDKEDKKEWWYRAKLMCKIGKSKCKVILVDVGSYVIVPSKNMRYLRNSFLQFLPIQAIWCKSNLPCKTGLPGSEKIPIGKTTRKRFWLAMSDRELGVYFHRREDPRGPWIVTVDELHKSRDPHCTSVKRIDLVNYSTWAIETNIQGQPYDIVAKRKQNTNPDKVADYKFVNNSSGGKRYYSLLGRHPEVIKHLYFGYFYPEHNVIQNFRELVRRSPSPHKKIYNFYDSTDENEIENNSVGSDTDSFPTTDSCLERAYSEEGLGLGPACLGKEE